ncbi:MAG TPA: NAD-dependent epimerase/dehydratase family protein [Vitreimonas sp.]|nr:NAD-dependent epimerase/dehydratase family protein [Vitreimonas sp.]
MAASTRTVATKKPAPARPQRAKEGVVLVTGSSGFIGGAIIRALAHRFDIVGFDRDLPKSQAAPFDAIKVDLASDRSIRQALHRVRQEHGDEIVSAIHLAAYYDLSGDPNPNYEKITVKGTERLLRAISAFKVEQFILASTMLVHAPHEPGQKLTEDAPLEAKSPYPQSKIEAERVTLARHGDIPAVMLRFAGVYDEMCRAAFLAEQIAAIFEKRFISRVFPGDIDRGQPYLHLDDLVDCVVRAIDRRKRLPPETTLLIGEPETPTYRQLQERIGELVHGEAWKTMEIPKPLAMAGQWLQEDVLNEDPFVQPWMIRQAGDHYELDVSAAQRLLDWRPRHRLMDTLPEMIAALKADPKAWYQANKMNPSRVATEAVLAQAEPQPKRDPHRTRLAIEALKREHRQALWAPMAIVGIGLWLIFSPDAFALFDAARVADAPVPPAAGRELPGAALRNAWLGWSDIVSGALLMLFGALSLSRTMGWARWASAGVGGWLMFAPLLFWTPSAAAYANDTLAGALAVAFAIMVGSPPGIAAQALTDKTDTPAGWSYSPSTYVQRVPIVALAFVGFLIARYLTSFQLGHIPAAWDPAFGNGTEVVITSWASHAWPIPDAGVGAATYLVEALTGAIGDRRRWRTMPWLVFAFGLMIVPLGAVSIAFIIIQPTLIGTWCGLCLVTAAITVVLIPYSLDELVATLQFLAQSKRAGRSLWRTFWVGGSLPGGGCDPHPGIDSPPGVVLKTFATGGVTFPPTLLACAAIGVLLMCTRLLFGTEGAMADSDHVVGCLVITIAVTALAEVGRPVRLLTVPLGAWLILAPFVLGGAGFAASFASVIFGAALILFSLPRGRLSGEHYGGWDKWII